MKTGNFAVALAIVAALLIVGLVSGMFGDLSVFGDLSTVAWFVSLGVLGGVVVACILSFSRGKPEVASVEGRNAGIRIDSIPITGGVGSGLLILILLIGVVIDVPEIRYLALPGVLGGLLFGVVLIYRSR
jgi:hypothetical protein